MNRKEIIQFLEKEETYNQVLGIIKNECHNSGTHFDIYPNEYFLAGGSVANTIYYLLNKEKFDKPVINDVDLFYFNHRKELYWNLNHNLGEDSFIQEDINVTTNLDGYGGAWLGSNGEQIKMVGSERFGVINKITIDVNLWQKEFIPMDYYEQLLHNFDLNCVHVGLNRITNKIVYTDKFIDFLKSNQIEVTGINHPLQTAVRMYKKSKELLTDTSNFEVEMDLLQHSFIYSPTKVIGPEWMAKIDLYGDFLRNYFIEDPILKQTNTENLYNYTSKDFTIKKYVSQFNFRHKNSLVVFWDIFIRVKSVDILNKILNFYSAHKYLKLNEVPKKWRRQTDITLFDSERFVNNNSYFDFTDCMSISPVYFEVDFEVSDLLLIDRFFNYLKPYSSLDPKIFIVKNVREQLKFIDFIANKFIDKHGNLKESVLSKTILLANNTIKDKLNISSLDVNVKIESFNKSLNNIWIKPKNRFVFKHKFIKNLFTRNLIIVDDFDLG
jgi:hypothetical protein